MWPTIGEVLPQAVGVAISPVPVALVIMILVSGRARTNGPAFAVGWVVSVAATVGVFTALARAANASGDATVSDGVNWLQVAFGLLFIWLAVRQWRSRPRAGEAPEEPKVFALVGGLGVAKALGLGVAAAAANPKNLALGASAGGTIAQAGLDTAGAVGAVVAYVVVGSLTVVVPVAAYLAVGERARGALDTTKEWLTANNATIMIVLFVVLAAKMLGSGLQVTV